jgi:hypothetical protein
MSSLWEISISLASAVVAACALGITVWQACLTRKHNQLSVQPYLTTSQFENAENHVFTLTISLENCGIGPAIIKNFIFFDGDQEIARNNYHLVESYLKNNILSAYVFYFGFCVPGFAISAGTNHLLLQITSTSGPVNMSLINRLNIIVEYQSIYQDDVFVYDSRNDRIFHGREVQDA